MDRPSGAAATTAALAIVAATAAVAGVGVAYFADTAHVVLWSALLLCETLTAAAVGALIVRRRPRNAVGWLLLAHGFLVAATLGYDGYAEAFSPDVRAWADGHTEGTWVFAYVALALIGYVFPDGRFRGPRWRRFTYGWLGCYAAFVAVTALAPESPAALVPLAGVAASLFGAAACARVRLRQAAGAEREQMLWFVWAALAIPAGIAVCWTDYWLTGEAGPLTFIGVTVAGSVIPLAIGVAVLRRGLFDIELVLSRTLTYGALTVLVVAVYAAMVLGVGGLVGAGQSGGGPAGLLAVGVVAVAIQPVHAAVRRRAERWVYGDRSDPYSALRRLAARLEGSLSPDEVLATVTGSVAEALRVRRAVVELQRDMGSPQIPPTAANMVRAPLTYQATHLGTLAVEVPPGRQLTTADRRLLDDLARQAAIVVNAVHLTLDLRRSRARLVTAREEERRRLRRDLHDGLGTSLAAIVLKLDAVATVATGPQAGRLLRELRAETRAAIAEIRRLVDDLRPPALDEMGLVAAIRQQAQRLSRQAADAPTITVSGPESPPPLPAAAEVAAYRIAAEALTNVVRHSGASHCTVTIAVDGALEVRIADNGTAATPGTRPGVGWDSMRERAAELSGACTIARRPEGGTLVRAVLPLPVAVSAGET
ncbi:sensor histidine kinase [Streptomyces boninensis]|uniref:sensor histidine kinase n=1 Tax=Streptomyces boninensis TaxID=2039455 RepID=UPI003B21258D